MVPHSGYVTTGSRVQVLVVGAGVGGLSLAGFLEQAGLEPVVIDSAESLDTPRGTVELSPGAIRVLDHLGVEGAVRQAGQAVTTWTRRRPDGTVVSRLDAADECGLLTVEYGRLRRCLCDHLHSGAVHTGTTLASLHRERGGVTVEFANGVREQFDIVVGADGVQSRTRALLGGSEPAFRGTTSIAVTLDAELEPGVAGEVWTPDGAVFRVLPVADRLTGWLTVPTTAPGQGWTDARPAALCPDIDWLLPNARLPTDADGGDSWWADDFHAPADRFADGQVALLGDAAHARHRLAGVGATLAIEDAAVLTSELVGSDGPLAARLMDYAARRQSRLAQLGGSPHDGGTDLPLASVESALAERAPEVTRTRGACLQAGFSPESPTVPVDPPSDDTGSGGDGNGGW